MALITASQTGLQDVVLMLESLQEVLLLLL
jgi:hypothetical protein